MEPSHPLKALLQLQLATDSSAVLHLPYTLASLTHECLLPSSHLSKWTTRINSLLHSKDAGARWAGLCLAYKTSLLSRNTMIEYAQSWLGVALPMLSKNEPVPNLKAAIRLLRIIFSTAIGIPEFQRQVATPNVPKFNAAIISLAEKHSDDELKILILESLTKLVPLYPTLNRASHAALSALTLRFLSGNAPNPSRMPLLEAASHLYSVLPHTGGKVGAANLWRKSVDETLAFGWSAFFALRTTFPTEGRNVSRDTAVSTDEAVMAIPLNVDRLRCCTVVLCNLLSATTQRPVQLPLGPLVKFTTTLLLCTKDDKGKEHIDPTVHAMELSIIPEMWKSSCNLISCLAKCARHHLTPNLTRLVSYLTFHLEQKPTAAQRLTLLTTVQALLVHCHPLDSPLIPTRLAKAVLPSLAVILATPSEAQASADSTASSNKNKKGKKRARAYEGDEVFKLSREVICPNADDGKVLLAALEVMRLLLRNPNLSPAMQSISARVLLSVLLALPQMTPASLSRDPGLHRELHQLVQTVNNELGSGTTSGMSKSLGLVIRSTISGEDHDEALRQLEILIHPRVPPLVRSLPHVETLSLFRAEEPQEEIDVREELGLHGVLPDAPPSSQDVDMEDDITPSPYVKDTALEPVKAPPIPKLNASVDSAPENPSYSAPQKPGPQIPTSSLITPPLPKVAIPPPPSPSAPMQPMVAAADDEEDEEMPAINMDSDSEEDE